MRKINTIMKDLTEYNEFYEGSCVKLYYLRIEGTYSIVKSDRDGYVEVLVAKDELEEALAIPESYEQTITGKMNMLFGNSSGFENFIRFCDQKNIETVTYFWE